MNKVLRTSSILLVMLAILTSACKANISRNEDGTFTVETTITQQELQEVISSSIADPLITNVTVALQQGYVSVSADHQRLNDASKTDTLSFRLDLSVNNGQLAASITDAQIDGIANRLSNFGERRENATMQSVIITPEIITMTWSATR
jgi:hypothetical protein